MKPVRNARDLAACTPTEARTLFRAGTVATTSGIALGYAQANLFAIPREFANEVRLFAHHNPQACPVLEVTEPGSWRSRLAPRADLRTDLPGYRLWRNGELAEEKRDVRADWREDLVTFLIGCSFSFETLLRGAGIPLRHVEQSGNVSMFITDRECTPAGRMSGPLVVSMRPIPAHQVQTAIRISATMPAVHGAPVHVGAPQALGIGDLSSPDFGDPVEFEQGDVPVFWACGVTSQTAVMRMAPPFAITHIPGHMFITDVRDVEYQAA